MKVAFWNGIAPAEGVTDNLAAIATTLSLFYHCDVVLGSNYIKNHMLQDCYSGKMKEEGIAHVPYQLSYGDPEYFRKLWEMKRNRQGDVLEVPMEGVTIIYPPDVTDKKMFYYQVPRKTIYIMDVAGENHTASQSALEEADIIVIFLKQDSVQVQQFFYQYSVIVPKAVFVVDDYQKKGGESFYKYAENCGVNREEIEIFPRNCEYKMACEEGKLEFFIRENLRCPTKNPHYNFMLNLKSIARVLYERSMKEY